MKKYTNYLNIFSQNIRYLLASMNIPVTENERDFLDLKNRYQGKRAFIIGNGPSLNKLDLTKMKNEFTFGVNAIYLNYEKMGFYPTFYVIEDKLVAEDRFEEINNLKGPIKFYGNYLNYCLDNGDNVIWMNVRFVYKEYSGFPRFSTDAIKKLWVGGTVSYLCMQLAYYFGFKEVYLVGFDHSYSIPNQAEVNGTTILSKTNDPNHFTNEYFGEGYRWHLPRVERMEEAYKKAKLYFQKDGRKIYNATKGGELEVFERVDYKTLFK